MMRLLHQIGADERGNSFIEMALVAPVIATLLVGTIDISRACSDKLRLEQAAQHTIELVQRASYQTDDDADLEADAEAAAGDGSSADVTAWLECDGDGVHLDYDDATCDDGAAYARYVQITVSKPFTPLFGTRFFPGANDNGTVTISSTAGIRAQ
ncbi:MAG TPA: TadE/TadG family type IV pilus assembly protein [Sphingomicrobium sp.]|nr:TadE/TadG family type IV pilus assembly protein [Sphingomicrobium sp.]